MKLDNRLVGTWVSAQPFDSEDYLVEYCISVQGQKYKVKARDYRDGEEMKISRVQYNGRTLEFTSLMPSTSRKGLNRFRVIDDDRLEADFTFTVRETLKKVAPDKDLYSRSVKTSAKRAGRKRMKEKVRERRS